jgi:hypothetical protein
LRRRDAAGAAFGAAALQLGDQWVFSMGLLPVALQLAFEQLQLGGFGLGDGSNGGQ